MDDSTLTSLSRTARESKGFVGICSIPCPCCHTASPACDISAYANILWFDRRQARREQARNRVGLVVADLEHDPTVWNYAWNPCGEAAEDVQPIAPAVERRPRIETANLGVEPGDLAAWYIGRIADQDIELAGYAFEQVGCNPPGAVSNAQSARVGAPFVILGGRPAGWPGPRAAQDRRSR